MGFVNVGNWVEFRVAWKGRDELVPTQEDFISHTLDSDSSCLGLSPIQNEGLCGIRVSFAFV